MVCLWQPTEKKDCKSIPVSEEWYRIPGKIFVFVCVCGLG